MRRIEKVLVANRGEIAGRIMRTCRAMGLETVAVFSDADAEAPHVRGADQAVRLGPAPSRESYLNVDAILRAAALTGADAVHPGYGFLAENAEFAQACADAGLVFVGPSPEVIRRMGSKIEARQLALDADVPIVPGYSAPGADDATLRAEADKIGFPLLLKASAGGGGKGMRIVRSMDDFDAALAAARREAEAAFGDGAMMVERYIERPRHVEIQILGDHHGNVVHLFERECSIQRRHQKIIEEAPSPALDPELRRTMGEAAVALAASIGYANAGTVEFILDPEGRFYFLEVNTRLQVEHPVTEEVTGLDLVREQLRVASGEPLGYGQEDLGLSGAAIECRIYAEDPSTGFLPSTGRLLDWHLPDDLDGVRLDAGVETGQQVSVHYDPMLAKLIVHAPTRAQATQRMIHALNRLSVQGVRTNRAFLLRVLRHEAWRSGDLSTHFIDRHFTGDLDPAPDAALVQRAIAAAALHRAVSDAQRPRHLPAIAPGWRNNPFAPTRHTYHHRDDAHALLTRHAGHAGLAIGFDPDAPDALARYEALALDGPTLRFQDPDGVRRTARVVRDPQDPDQCAVLLDGVSVALTRAPRFPDPTAESVEGGCIAPMPGQIVQVLVTPDQAVTAGDPLVILEAMKMEHTVRAPSDGIVRDVRVQPGDQVEADAVLILLDANDDDANSTD